MQTVASAYDSSLTNNAHEAHITNVDNGNGKRFPSFRCDSTAKYRTVRIVRPVRSVRTWQRTVFTERTERMLCEDGNQALLTEVMRCIPCSLFKSCNQCWNSYKVTGRVNTQQCTASHDS